MTEEVVHLSPMSSAIPWMPASGHSVRGRKTLDVWDMPRNSSAARIGEVWDQVQPAQEETGVDVFVANGIAVPDPDWALISVAAGPSRKALVADLWDSISQSVQIVGRDNDSTTVPADSLGFARKLLTELPQYLQLPQASVSQDGELIFVWFRNCDCLSATLEPDHYLTWVVKRSNRIEDGEVIAFDDINGERQFFDAIKQFYE